MQHLVRSVAALLLAIALAACGDSSAASVSHPSPSPPTPIGPLVVTTDGCSYQGPGRIGAGLAEVHLVDQSKARFQVDVWQLDASHTYAELDAYIKEEERRVKAGEPQQGYPSFATLTDQLSVSAAGDVKRQISVAAGTYGFVCFPTDAKTAAGIWLAGPLVVAK